MEAHLGKRTALGGPFNMRLDYTEAELAKSVEALPIDNAPGEKWNYPESTQNVLQAVAPLWPGGTLTLVRRVPAPYDATRVFSTHRLTKGDHRSSSSTASTPKAKSWRWASNPIASIK
jgi:hypothetical protein